MRSWSGSCPPEHLFEAGSSGQLQWLFAATAGRPGELGADRDGCEDVRGPPPFGIDLADRPRPVGTIVVADVSEIPVLLANGCKFGIDPFARSHHKLRGAELTQCWPP